MKADDHLRTVANQYAPVPERIDLPHISMSNLDALKERLAPIAGFTFEEYASNSLSRSLQHSHMRTVSAAAPLAGTTSRRSAAHARASASTT